MQDAFVALHRKAGDLRDPDAALAYLRTSVLNLSRSVIRRRQVARKHLKVAEPEATAGGRPRRPAARRAPRRAARRCGRCRATSARCWCCGTGRGCRSGRSPQTLGISAGSVKSAASRGMAALHEMLRTRESMTAHEASSDAASGCSATRSTRRRPRRSATTRPRRRPRFAAARRRRTGAHAHSTWPSGRRAAGRGGRGRRRLSRSCRRSPAHDRRRAAADSAPRRRRADPAPRPAPQPVGGKPVHVRLLNAEGELVGVGMPVIAYFSKPITDARAFATATTVTVNGKPSARRLVLREVGRRPGLPDRGPLPAAELLAGAREDPRVSLPSRAARPARAGLRRQPRPATSPPAPRTIATVDDAHAPADRHPRRQADRQLPGVARRAGTPDRVAAPR